ncbi:hypothetical protein FraEuI1c_3601 [Pseudofrankia inefficax]|uniref:Uncharacterized protein n=1 Tax=Pseudofrankia inefficax (strain DSM 45817 / CECT 9037 / DDB 130130 / EuI1c) TaxID=298654 RepID=E3J0H9_PSEI1|nr:hypothetical protein FraEuI1c_3601 [Pseudofrankia inefficax]
MTRWFNTAGPRVPSKHHGQAWIRREALIDDAPDEDPCG